MASLSELFHPIFQTDLLTSEIIASAIVFVLVAVVGWVSYYIFSKYIAKWAGKTKTTLDDEIIRSIKTIAILLLIILGVYYAVSSLTIVAESEYSTQINQIFAILSILLTAFAITRVSNVLINWYMTRRTELQSSMNSHLLFIFKKIIQLIVYVIAFLIILSVLTIDLSGVVVGLGVGGIAIALAIQNTLSDVFSAFSKYFDRPFEIGDFVVIGEQAGTVTNIGIKSTRVQLLQGEELVISNKELTSAQVRNFKKLEKRRVTFTIGVTFDTPTAKLKKIPEIITAIINKQELVNIDRVHFSEFGDFSLKFEVVYYVQVADYTKYMDVQQAINFAIKEEFEKENIEIAFPTQTIQINK